MALRSSGVKFLNILYFISAFFAYLFAIYCGSLSTFNLSSYLFFYSSSSSFFCLAFYSFSCLTATGSLFIRMRMPAEATAPMTIPNMNIKNWNMNISYKGSHLQQLFYLVPIWNELLSFIFTLSSASFFLLHFLVALLNWHCLQIYLLDILRQWLNFGGYDASLQLICEGVARVRAFDAGDGLWFQFLW